MIDDIPCVILAGGKSSRMGQNKALLPFGGYKSLAEFQHTRLKKVFRSLYISCKEPSVFNFSAAFIVDESLEFAPIFALHRAFDVLDGAIFFIPVDTPFFDEESIVSMLSSGGSVIAKSGEKTHNLVAVYTQEAKFHIRDMIKKGDYKISHLAAKVGAKFIEFEEGGLINLNTKEEYEKAMQYPAHCVSINKS